MKKILSMKYYLRLAFLSVLMTYFGCNYLLTGMHSYAGTWHFETSQQTIKASAANAKTQNLVRTHIYIKFNYYLCIQLWNIIQ